MSFHPEMQYEGGFHRSQRKLPPEGEPFAFTPERRQKFEELASHYPPEQRKSAILYALFMVQDGLSLGRLQALAGSARGETTLERPDGVAPDDLPALRSPGHR